MLVVNENPDTARQCRQACESKGANLCAMTEHKIGNFAWTECKGYKDKCTVGPTTAMDEWAEWYSKDGAACPLGGTASYNQAPHISTLLKAGESVFQPFLWTKNGLNRISCA